MADYNRFISYIYLYERGIKTMNTGFAKVESRSGQCRVSITMKNMYHESHVKFSVYMFVRKEKRLLGIYLGELQTQNSAGTFDGGTDADNIQGSGYTLDDVRGMIIQGDNGKIYGTGWDDEALDVSRFVPMLQGGEVALQEEASQAGTAAREEESFREEEPSQAGMAARENPLLSEPAPPKGADSALEEPAPPKGADSALEEPALSKDTDSALEEPALPKDTASALGEPALPKGADSVLGEPAPLKSQIFASGETAPKSAHPFLSELMKTGAAYADPKLPQKLDSTVPVEELKSLNLKAESMGAAAKLPVEAEGEKSSPGSTALSPGSSALEKIMDQGMRMFPFEDDEMTACVRMEPQDIGLLPMPYWRLAGNSFLLHGYYRYRHLIMARKKDGTFVFGVPGVDDERERFMADMFGFTRFKPVRAHAAGPGQFGYWYMELEESLPEAWSVV